MYILRQYYRDLNHFNQVNEKYPGVYMTDFYSFFLN